MLRRLQCFGGTWTCTRNGASSPEVILRDRHAPRAFRNYRRLVHSMTLEFSREAMDVIGVSSEQISDYKKTFLMFDSDKDGVISLGELRIVLKSLGQKATEKEIKKMAKETDEHGNRVVALKAFLDWMTEKQKYQHALEEEVRQAFSYFDVDGDGFISMNELRQVAIQLGEDLTEEEIDEMIREADADGDGQVDFEEFMKVMTFDPEAN